MMNHRLPHEMLRTHCCECSAPVDWVDVGVLAARGIDVSDLTTVLEASSAADLETWICPKCDTAGAFGLAQMAAEVADDDVDLRDADPNEVFRVQEIVIQPASRE
jgi:hypothetical protein